MLMVIFTLDYEIHGNGDGVPLELMVEPTERLMRLFEEYDAKLTIMADVAEILKFAEYAEQTGCDDFHSKRISQQLRRAVGFGHDVELHIHPGYFNAYWVAGRWLQDWSEYNFATLPFERMTAMVARSRQYLEGLLKPVDPDSTCIAFRAANWAVSPSANVVRALVENGIVIDTSVFKHGRRNGIVTFDYSSAPSSIGPWLVDSEDICRVNSAGQLMEMPIYSECRRIGAFLTVGRIRQVLGSIAHPVGGILGRHRGTPALVKMLKQLLHNLSSLHAWKADFNQCTGRQLIAALKRARCQYDPDGSKHLPFVLIGHSKLFTRHNERTLRLFLDFVSENQTWFRFGTFKDVLPQFVSTAVRCPAFRSNNQGKEGKTADGRINADKSDEPICRDTA